MISISQICDIIHDRLNVSEHFNELVQLQTDMNGSLLKLNSLRFDSSEILCACNLQRLLANDYRRIGETKHPETLQVANLRLLNAVPVSELSKPTIDLCRAMAQAALQGGRIDPDLFQSALRAESGSRMLSGMIDGAFAELTVGQVSWGTGYDLVLPGEPPNHDSPAAWTNRVLFLIRQQCSLTGRDPSCIPRVAWSISGIAFQVATKHRHLGRLAESSRTADRLGVLASTLIRLYPKDPYPHLIASEAENQKAKNSYRLPDENAAKRQRRAALAAALRANTLDPENMDARRVVDDRRRQMGTLDGQPSLRELSPHQAGTGRFRQAPRGVKRGT